MANLVDLYLVYRILRRLTQPFTDWEAYKQGVIDADGNIVKDKNQRFSTDEQESFTKFDLLILKLKKLLGTIPFGKTKLASYAAALWFLKEEKKLTEDNLQEEFEKFCMKEKFLSEEAPANVASSGAVAGLTGDPPVGKKAQKKYTSRFANNEVFVVDSKTYNNARLGKQKYHRYERYVGNDEIGMAIREYGKKYPKKPIILQDGENGPMIFLRRGRNTFKEHVELKEEISATELKGIEMYADKLFKAVGIDVEFTRHFLDRVNDARNVKDITPTELALLFRKTYAVHGQKIPKLGPDAEAVIADMKSDINLPFVLKWDRNSQEFDLVAKTVMRKKNFMTSNPKLKV